MTDVTPGAKRDHKEYQISFAWLLSIGHIGSQRKFFAAFIDQKAASSVPSTIKDFFGMTI